MGSSYMPDIFSCNLILQVYNLWISALNFENRALQKQFNFALSWAKIWDELPDYFNKKLNAAMYKQNLILTFVTCYSYKPRPTEAGSVILVKESGADTAVMTRVDFTLKQDKIQYIIVTCCEIHDFLASYRGKSQKSHDFSKISCFLKESHRISLILKN